MVRVIVQLVAVAVLNAVGQLALKLGADALEPVSTVVARPWTLLGYPYLLAGGGLYLVSLVLYVEALSRTRLSIAYPFIGSTYVLVVVMGVVVLDEPYNARVVAGTLLVFVGVSLLGTGLGAN